MGVLKIDILGTSFSIKANEDDVYLKHILDTYKSYTDKIEQNGSLKNPLQISILAGIMLCDDFQKLKANTNSFSNNQTIEDIEAERITLSLIDKIDQALK